MSFYDFSFTSGNGRYIGVSPKSETVSWLLDYASQGMMKVVCFCLLS